jgi:hypothetical protein
MGRPAKKPEDRKRYQLHVPLTDAQHAVIAEAARLEGQDKAAWVRAVLLDVANRRIAKDAKAKGG